MRNARFFNIVSLGWPDYSLLDSGNLKKLERVGGYKIIRPEPQAIWKPRRSNLWEGASAEFAFASEKGIWKNKKLPPKWEICFEDIKFFCKTNSFKHIGFFPEQAPNWKWISKMAAALPSAKVLNLFGYSGIASIAAAKAGAFVAHIDSSSQANDWCKENIFLSGLKNENRIRVLLDDALKFSKRELKRGNFYDGIILDPPAFGRGKRGEVWRIERDLPVLLEILFKLLRKRKNSFFLLNSYAAGYSPESLKQLVESFIGGEEDKIFFEFGEMQIKEFDSERVLPSGVYSRFFYV